MLGSFRKIIFPALFLTFLLQGSAHADKVDRLVAQLKGSKDYKIRLSAAVNLAKLNDKRALPALIKALGDSDKNVRGVAATSLGKLVAAGVAPKLHGKAKKALERAASKDGSSFVRKQAKRALAGLEGSGGAAPAGGVYVNIGAMSAKTQGAAAMRDLMRKTAEKTFAKKASSMVTNWPGGKPPTAAQLKKGKTQAFHVDGTLVSLTTQVKGSTTLVECKISMLIATYPKKSMFGFLDGGAKVQTGSSEQSVQYGMEDCVAAVVEDLVTKKIIPTIETRSKP